MTKPTRPIGTDQAMYLMLVAVIKLLDMEGEDNLVEVTAQLLVDQEHPGDRARLRQAANHLADEFTVRATAIYHDAQEAMTALARRN